MAPFPCAVHRRVSLSRGLNILLCALAVASSQSLVSHAFVSTSLVRFSYRYGGGFPTMQQQGSCNNAAAGACAATTASRTPLSAATTIAAAQTSSPPRAYIRGAAAAAGRVGETPKMSAASVDGEKRASSALFSETPAAPGGEGSELLEKIKDVVSDQLKVDRAKVHLESNFIKDLNADSLDSVELVMAFEEKFGVTIPDEAATKIATVQDALSYITNALGSKESGGTSTVEKA